jgi:hypothetical protein
LVLLALVLVVPHFLPMAPPVGSLEWGVFLLLVVVVVEWPAQTHREMAVLEAVVL